jgi:hypothetical protein
MKAHDLAVLLLKSPDMDVMILDGFNGGGTPRELNLVTVKVITEDHAEVTADCEDRIDEQVLVLGFGNY